jgi:hypothetical protein
MQHAWCASPVQLRPLLRESVRARVRVTSCACGACARPGHGGRRWPRAPAPGHYGLACRSPALARPLQNGHDARERLTLNYIYERFTARTATGHTHDLQSCTRQLSSSSARLTSLDRGGTSRSSIAAAALRESVSVTHCRRTSYDRPVRRVDTPRVSSALEPSSSGALSLSTTLNAQRGCGMRLRRAGSGRGARAGGAAGAVSLARAPGVRGDMRSSDLKQIDASPALAQRSFNILNTS